MLTETFEISARRYLALDALRGTAAFAVLFYHLRNLDVAGRPVGSTSAFASGYLAVDMFFLLSGFVISHAYGHRLQSTLSFRQFMIARFVRLQPMIAIGTMIGFALSICQRLMAVDSGPGLFAVITSLPTNLLMLPNILVPWGIFLFNPPAWSLFYEMIANAIYALGIKGIAGRKPRICSRVSVDFVLMAVCLAGLLALGMSLALTGNLDKGVVLHDAPIALARIAFSFSLGLLIHRCRQVWMPRIPKLPMPWLLATCIILLAPAFSGISRAIYDLTFVTVLSPFLVMLSAAAPYSARMAPMADWLGKISYPLYALHAPIKHSLETIIPFTFFPLFISCACTCVIFAWFVATAIDPAARRWLGARLQAPMSDASTPALAPVHLQRGG